MKRVTTSAGIVIGGAYIPRHRYEDPIDSPPCISERTHRVVDVILSALLFLAMWIVFASGWVQ